MAIIIYTINRGTILKCYSNPRFVSFTIPLFQCQTNSDLFALVVDAVVIVIVLSLLLSLSSLLLLLLLLLLSILVFVTAHS
jgi:hypothetical protein